VKTILNDIDGTLSEFIVAQMMIAGIVAFFLFCGYLIIGLPHPLALALFAMIFYVIPFLGTFIAIIPALLIGLSISLPMAGKVILVMIIAHLIEGHLLTPRLMSSRLKIHPLTVILLLLAAGSLYGILGLLLVTPTYAILKVLTWNLYKISRLHYTIAKNKAVERTSNELPTA
jgi:predicted PurR-regulated permease PerM